MMAAIVQFHQVSAQVTWFGTGSHSIVMLLQLQIFASARLAVQAQLQTCSSIVISAVVDVNCWQMRAMI
jgi:hypothetical protein